MKFIFAIIICLFLPVSVMATDCDVTSYPSNDQQSECASRAGCGWSNGDCAECNSNEYSPANDSTCHPCATQNSDNTWTWSITPPTANSVFDYENATTGQSSCPWKCDTDYYKNNIGNGCVQCPIVPTVNTEGNTLYKAEIQTYINSCSCGSNFKLIHHINDNSPTPHQYYCGLCGYEEYYNNYGTSYTGNVYECNECQTYKMNHFDNAQTSNQDVIPYRYECGCPTQSGANNSTGYCTCNDPGAVMTSDTSGTYTIFSCATCDSSRHLVAKNGQCVCDKNYYGNNNIGCTQCPAGTSTYYASIQSIEPGATSLAECVMVSNITKFCDANGNNCKPLIPDNATITQPGGQ